MFAAERGTLLPVRLETQDRYSYTYSRYTTVVKIHFLALSESFVARVMTHM
jgi:hypothetical protein